MLALATLLACALTLKRLEHQKVAIALALMFAVNSDVLETTLSPAQNYLLFPIADLWLTLAVLCRFDWRVSLAATVGGWLLAGATYGAETALCAHALTGAVTLGALLFSEEGTIASPEAAVATVLGLSDLAAIYPLMLPSELWNETARPQSLATWTIVVALEIYWMWRRPPSRMRSTESAI